MRFRVLQSPLRTSISHQPVISVDYLPTIAAATGVKLPAERTIDGQDLSPLFASRDGFERENLYWHFPHYRGRGVVPYSIIRQGDWKLIKWYEGPRYELYNLAEDLSETKDLAANMPQQVEMLDTQLGKWLAEAGANLPKLNPNYAGK